MGDGHGRIEVGLKKSSTARILEWGSGVRPPGRTRSPIEIREEPFGKRFVDWLLAATMMVVSAPVYGMVALAIRLEDGGPVFYEQERYGRGGEKIRVRKFRTMVPDSDHRFGIRQAKEGDPRITRVGRVLRACGLDELPQILSILKGDMSFVGPRPLAVGEVVEDERGEQVPWEWMRGFRRRLAVRPGLTSLATIYLPKDTHPVRKFSYDLLYVRKQSLALDLRLILVSFWISFTGRWESRKRKV